MSFLLADRRQKDQCIAQGQHRNNETTHSMRARLMRTYPLTFGAQMYSKHVRSTCTHQPANRSEGHHGCAEHAVHIFHHNFPEHEGVLTRPQLEHRTNCRVEVFITTPCACHFWPTVLCKDFLTFQEGIAPTKKTSDPEYTTLVRRILPGTVQHKSKVVNLQVRESGHTDEAKARRDETMENASNSLTQTQRKRWLSTSTGHQCYANAPHNMKQTQARTLVATGIDCIATSLQAHHTSTSCFPARALCLTLCAALGHENRHSTLSLHNFYAGTRPPVFPRQAPSARAKARVLAN